MANAFAHPPTSGPGVVDGKIIENLDGEYGFIENPLKGLVIGHGHLHEYRNQLNGSVRFNYKLDFLTKGLSTHATISYQNYNTHTIRYVKNMVTYKLIETKTIRSSSLKGKTAILKPMRYLGKIVKYISKPDLIMPEHLANIL